MERYEAAGKGRNNFILCYKKYMRNITSYVGKMVHNHDVALELTHDTFMKLYEKEYELDPEAPRTLNLIITVAKNTAYDYLKRKKNEQIKYQVKHFEEVALNEELYRSLEDHYIEAEVLSTLNDVISTFPENMRGALIDRLYGGQKVCTVSEKRKISKYRIRMAERELRNSVRKMYSDSV